MLEVVLTFEVSLNILMIKYVFVCKFWWLQVFFKELSCVGRSIVWAMRKFLPLVAYS